MRERVRVRETTGFRLLRTLLQEERGATALEYSLLVSLIFMVVLAAIGTTGSDLGGRWNSMATVITDNLLPAR